jgi:hypothetical protein
MTQRFPSVHSRYSIRAPQLQGEPRHTSALHGFNEASFAAGQRAQASHRETAISRDALAWREVLWGMPRVQSPARQRFAVGVQADPLLGRFTGDGCILGGDEFPFPVAPEPGVSPDQAAESFGLPLEFAG